MIAPVPPALGIPRKVLPAAFTGGLARAVASAVQDAQS
jgi:hypothetical protein